MRFGRSCCTYPVLRAYFTRNAISHVNVLNFYISAQYFESLFSAVPWCCAFQGCLHIFFEWFCDAFSCLFRCWYHFFFYISHMLFAFKPFLFETFRLLSWSHFCLLKSQHLSTHVFVSIVTNCDIRFLVRDRSVGVHLLIPQYGYLYLNDLPLLILAHAHTSVLCLILPLFPCIC
jgi:hypothetical protein